MEAIKLSSFLEKDPLILKVNVNYNHTLDWVIDNKPYEAPQFMKHDDPLPNDEQFLGIKFAELPIHFFCFDKSLRQEITWQDIRNVLNFAGYRAAIFAEVFDMCDQKYQIIRGYYAKRGIEKLIIDPIGSAWYNPADYREGVRIDFSGKQMAIKNYWQSAAYNANNLLNVRFPAVKNDS